MSGMPAKVWNIPEGTPRTDASVPLHPVIEQRWSPRALDPTATIDGEALRALFEAARWAPSWGNTQPARYLVGLRGDETFERIFDTLTPGNRSWAGAAAALVVGLVVTHDGDGKPLAYTDYGLALAVQQLAVQAVAEGWATHQMAGFDATALRTAFALPGTVEPRIVVAVGRPTDRAPEELLARDARPRHRIPLSELVFTKSWGTPAF